ncbi:hypothetical protein NQZ68_016882 [Dissostichus eleginoides]|nr:hypothetical protein NQZ68_016882 [Dissostichus eleginoides]
MFKKKSKTTAITQPQTSNWFDKYSLLLGDNVRNSLSHCTKPCEGEFVFAAVISGIWQAFRPSQAKDRFKS